MNNDQRLYPQKIYQINQRLEEFKQACGIENKDVPVSFSVLNFHNRKFNWLIVNDDRWAFEGKNEYIIDNINHCIDSHHKSQWIELLDTLDKLENKEIADSIKYFRKKVDGIEWTEKERKDLHYHLLNLYQYYPHEAYNYYDGIVYRNFVNECKRLKYAEGEFLIDIQYDIAPWVDIKFTYADGQKSSFSAQDQNEDIEYTDNNKEDFRKLIERKTLPSESPETVYFNYIVPLIMGYPHPDEEGKVFDGILGSSITVSDIKWDVLLQEIQNGNSLTTKINNSELQAQLEKVKKIKGKSPPEMEKIVTVFDKIKDTLTFYKDEVYNKIELFPEVQKKLDDLKKKTILDETGTILTKTLSASAEEDIRWFNIDILKQLFPDILSKSRYFLKRDTLKELAEKYKFTLSFPVYDTFLYRKLCGNFYGNVTIFFASQDDRNAFVDNGFSVREGYRGNNVNNGKGEMIKVIQENLFLLIS